MNTSHLFFGSCWIIFITCFPCVNSQTFSSLGNCTPIDNCSTAAFSSTIVPSAGLPWSFNWVWHNNTAQVIIASVTVLTGDKPMVITPTNLFPYSYSITNDPDRSVVSPNNFKSKLIIFDVSANDSLVVGIPGSQSSPCQRSQCAVSEIQTVPCEYYFVCEYTNELFECQFPGVFSPTYKSCEPPTTTASTTATEPATTEPATTETSVVQTTSAESTNAPSSTKQPVIGKVDPLFDAKTPASTESSATKSTTTQLTTTSAATSTLCTVQNIAGLIFLQMLILFFTSHTFCLIKL